MKPRSSLALLLLGFVGCGHAAPPPRVAARPRTCLTVKRDTEHRARDAQKFIEGFSIDAK